jgi:hypothetical protein
VRQVLDATSVKSLDPLRCHPPRRPVCFLWPDRCPCTRPVTPGHLQLRAQCDGAQRGIVPTAGVQTRKITFSRGRCPISSKNRRRHPWTSSPGAFQSMLTPLALIGAPHFSISSATNLAKYSGPLRSAGMTLSPMASKRSRTDRESNVSPIA